MKPSILPIVLLLAGCAAPREPYFPPVEYVAEAELRAAVPQGAQSMTVGRDEQAKPVPITSRPQARTPLVLLRVEEGTQQPDVIGLHGTSWWADSDGTFHPITNRIPPRVPVTRYVLGIVTNGVEVEVVTVSKEIGR